MESVVDILRRNAGQCRGLNYCEALPLVGDNSIVPAVVGLLYARSPDAVVGLVSAIVILPLDRMSRTGPWPHVGQEVLEALPPAITYSDSARAVILISRSLRVGAARVHTDPREVFWRLSSPAALSMLCVFVGGDFAAQAPARLHGTLQKVMLPQRLLCSAIAAAKPELATANFVASL
jgi:hypothetical protein